MRETNLNYNTFVLGYDLLHDELGDLPCDIAYEKAREIAHWFDEWDSFTMLPCAEYEALQKFIELNYDDIVKFIKED